MLTLSATGPYLGVRIWRRLKSIPALKELKQIIMGGEN